MTGKAEPVGDGLQNGLGESISLAMEPVHFQCGWSLRYPQLLSGTVSLYGNCMARLISTTIRLDQEDVRALKRARAAGHSASELIRKGLRVVASRYYSGRRPPSTRLFESTDQKLGDESELFRNLEQ